MKTAILAAALIAAAAIPARAATHPVYALLECSPHGFIHELNDGQKALFILCMQSKGLTFVCRNMDLMDVSRCWAANDDD